MGRVYFILTAYILSLRKFMARIQAGTWSRNHRRALLAGSLPGLYLASFFNTVQSVKNCCEEKGINLCSRNTVAIFLSKSRHFVIYINFCHFKWTVGKPNWLRMMRLLVPERREIKIHSFWLIWWKSPKSTGCDGSGGGRVGGCGGRGGSKIHELRTNELSI